MHFVLKYQLLAVYICILVSRSKFGNLFVSKIIINSNKIWAKIAFLNVFETIKIGTLFWKNSSSQSVKSDNFSSHFSFQATFPLYKARLIIMILSIYTKFFRKFFYFFFDTAKKAKKIYFGNMHINSQQKMITS
jgi:hypothetical protein